MAVKTNLGTIIGGGGGAAVLRFTLSGATVPFEVIDAARRMSSTTTLTQVAISMLDSGSAGQTDIVIYRDGPSGPDNRALSLAANGGANASLTTLGVALSVQDGDLIWVDVISSASTGNPEELTVEIF